MWVKTELLDYASGAGSGGSSTSSGCRGRRMYVENTTSESVLLGRSSDEDLPADLVESGGKQTPPELVSGSSTPPLLDEESEVGSVAGRGAGRAGRCCRMRSR